MKTKNTTVKYNKTTTWKYKEYLASYLFILPALLLFVLFVVVPMIKGIYVSFF
jgi:multiple sugar transport system permease protein